ESVVENITQSEEKPAIGLVPPSIFPENEEGYFEDNDPDAAKEYLEEGLGELDLDELPKVKISYNTDEGHDAIAQALKDLWTKNLVVDTELNNEDLYVYLDIISEEVYQIGRIGWN